mmetsp:Transcript_69027/g.128935  ORF Transcript_69027/g.128935 Transcript_69027/m.128935 type:complete len:168 (+) Transcript_69027:81-584(+)
MGNASNCCSGPVADERANEHLAPQRRDPAPGTSDLKLVEETNVTVPHAVGSPPTVNPSAAQPQVETKETKPVPEVKESLGGQMFTITIDKRQGQKLGIDVDHQDGVTLLIEHINDGLVANWNKDYPEKEVKIGDRIHAVNGQKGEVLQLVAECQKDIELVMELRRGA